MIGICPSPFPLLRLPTSRSSPHPNPVLSDMATNLDKAFGSFRWLCDHLQSPWFLYEDAGTHGLCNSTSASDLDGNVETLCPKRTLTSSTMEDRDLAHLDTTIHRTLPLVSTILSGTEALRSSMVHTTSPEGACVHGNDDPGQDHSNLRPSRSSWGIGHCLVTL